MVRLTNQGVETSFEFYMRSVWQTDVICSSTDDRPQKKNKKSAANAETFYFHPEDEVLHKHALAQCNFESEKPSDEGASDAKRTFQELGVKPQGHLILIEAGKFEGAVKAVGEYLGAESAA